MSLMAFMDCTCSVSTLINSESENKTLSGLCYGLAHANLFALMEDNEKNAI